MTGRRLAVGLAAIITFLALASQAEAEMLSLDCSGPLGTTESIWVDIDKSVITQKFPDGSIGTEPATITATSISWNHVNATGTFTDEIDRTSGDYHYSGNDARSGQYIPGAHFQCIKGSTPFPATKF